MQSEIGIRVLIFSTLLGNNPRIIFCAEIFLDKILREE